MKQINRFGWIIVLSGWLHFVTTDLLMKPLALSRLGFFSLYTFLTSLIPFFFIFSSTSDRRFNYIREII